MGLNLPQVLPQVESMARGAAQEAQARGELLRILLRTLRNTEGLSLEAIQRLVQQAGPGWAGAVPIDEPLDRTFPPSEPPAHYSVLAADGSQIYPDRHAAATYYLINVGRIHLRVGSASAPETETRAKLVHRQEELYSSEGGLISSALIEAERDVMELEALAEWAKGAGQNPTLALLDNGLLLWLALKPEGQPRREVERVLRAYLGQLARLQASGTPVAGFVDRPRSANLIALLQLILAAQEETPGAPPGQPAFGGLTDRALFEQILPRGHRSARFRLASNLGEAFAQEGQEIHFFYLHSGQGNIARVELPRWAADDPQILQFVHSAIVDQCRGTQGFPYPLIRAHELAVVSQDERRMLDEMINGALLRHGLDPQRSRKAQTKRWLGRRRRARL